MGDMTQFCDFNHVFVVKDACSEALWMEPTDAPDMNTTHLNGDLLAIEDVGVSRIEDAEVDLESLRHYVDGMVSKVDELEQKMDKVSNFYSCLNTKQTNNSKGSSVVKSKDKEKQIFSIKKQQQDAAKREAAAAKRMQELMRQFATIMRQLAQHKWAYPFMQPVDVKGLGLHDYYEVIDKPMDFSTIKNQMEAKDGTGYKNVREIYADVRLVFKNAMTYNDDRNDVHVMAKSLLAKFEEKWLSLVPKVIEEETRRKEEEAEAQMNMQLAEEAANAKSARDIRTEILYLDSHLDELRETVVRKCRKISVEEKRKLGSGLSLLSPEDLTKSLEIIAQKNSNFQATAPEVDIDMDALSESTLWSLKFLVKDALEAKGKSAASKDNNEKRKKELCAAIKTAKKKNKKATS
ncbi:hypothetical protein GIB67_002093 [Kingdonia uniflora]|uniref:Uncharacterized protein n=1 Tax=Kingdonia uniflora TaxID=39325 RepID=A0A7J7KWK2_9MAGN|nr:hypothetical protein GIB67_002093 [Kingdonia uniflora]